MARAAMRTLVWSVSLDAKALIDDIDKALINIPSSAGLSGQLLNTASYFNFLDRGTREHTIEPGTSGYLANQAKGFIVRGAVRSPGQPPLDISARALTFFQSQLESKIAGPSTRSLANRRGELIDFDQVKNAFITSLRQAQSFASDITPSSWPTVKASFQAYFNGKRV